MRDNIAKRLSVESERRLYVVILLSLFFSSPINRRGRR